MTSKHDETQLSSEDERFVRAIDAHYQPPEPTPAMRVRFAARLDERIARGRGRARWRLFAAAAGAVALALIVARLPDADTGDRDATATAAASSAEASTEETLLILANGPLEDPDEALPEDYRTIASLLE